MGQKTNPIGFRLGVNRTTSSRWFAKEKFADLLYEDMLLRRYISRRLKHASIAKIEIERTIRKISVILHTARPGVVIGRKGEEVGNLRSELNHLTKQEININIRELKHPEVDSQLVADNIARQLEKRVAYRRAIKRSIQSAMRMGAQGIKIECGGRLNNAEIARTEKYKEGRVPLHTLRADIDYATSTAHTTHGCIGIKVWICKGEVVSNKDREIGQASARKR